MFILKYLLLYRLHNLAIEDLFNQYNHKHNGKMTFDEFYGLL